jgi:hypothetical protein
MIAKPYEQVVADLERVRVSRERLHDYYVRFCARAMDMTDAKCRAKGSASGTISMFSIWTGVCGLALHSIAKSIEEFYA